MIKPHPKHDLQKVLKDLQKLEPIFHHLPVGATAEQIEAITADDFWEVGASGRQYDRAYVIDTLVERLRRPHEDVWTASGFRCQEIAPDNYLLTYTLLQDGTRKTRRATIWRRTDKGWKIVYHQGTIVEPE